MDSPSYAIQNPDVGDPTVIQVIMSHDDRPTPTVTKLQPGEIMAIPKDDLSHVYVQECTADAVNPGPAQPVTRCHLVRVFTRNDCAV